MLLVRMRQALSVRLLLIELVELVNESDTLIVFRVTPQVRLLARSSIQIIIEVDGPNQEGSRRISAQLQLVLQFIAAELHLANAPESHFRSTAHTPYELF